MQTVIPALFFIVVGFYLMYEGLMRILSKKYYEKFQGRMAKRDGAYNSLFGNDDILQRYIRPGGWVVLGVFFVVSGILLLLKT